LTFSYLVALRMHLLRCSERCLPGRAHQLPAALSPTDHSPQRPDIRRAA